MQWKWQQMLLEESRSLSLEELPCLGYIHAEYCTAHQPGGCLVLHHGLQFVFQTLM